MSQLQKRRLGRGLAALIGDEPAEEGAAADLGGLRQVPIELLHPNPKNPRRQFDEEELLELAQSIREKGLLQPIVVRPRDDGRSFEIVAGERRWRAAQRAQLHEVPALVREVSDGESLEIALIENIQRANLNPLEEAGGYQHLIDQFGYTQQQLADSLGKSRSHVANTLRLLNLPEKVRSYVETGALTAGHARTLVAADAPDELAEQIIGLRLTVREAEQLAKGPAPVASSGSAAAAKPGKSADIRALESRLSEALGLKVEIADRGGSGGQIAIRYRTLEQLDEICRKLGHQP